ncbi:hypothetical protein ATO6_08450 [Oceanicola sp. 22II-s10i]|uniref:putative quinol monooxygenase n=1 Tax=Oceanicola sp. 22II-s10i TaxID=1317116 RepID=UPI000B51F0A7|nr:putative quinol monooxygenase [Oceanicola sp. 22II-s10i]OWU85075.1 hypothetical protein ATO6_08450 [Oceanicola sp. 22II-s10i]
MYIAIVTFPVAPADRPRATALLARDAAEARAMPGNLSFDVLTAAAAEDSVTVLHRWQDKSGLAAYLASPAFARIGAEVRPLMTGAPVSLRLIAEDDETLTG